MIQQCYSYKVMCHGAVVVGFDYWHGGPEERDVVFDCRLNHGLMDLVIDFWDLTGWGQEHYWRDIKSTDLKQVWLRTVAERPFSLYDARTIGARVLLFTLAASWATFIREQNWFGTPFSTIFSSRHCWAWESIRRISMLIIAGLMSKLGMWVNVSFRRFKRPEEENKKLVWGKKTSDLNPF